VSIISYSTFRSQLRRWGVTFVEHSRYDRCLKRTVPWYQHEARRYRDCARRGWDAHGIAIHHTGGPTAWSFVWDGRLSERIPGPLYIVEVYEDGVAHLTGWGVSNNVGACDKTTRDRVLAGRMPTSGEVRPGSDDYYAANSEFYGLAYRGTTRNSKQRATMLRICAAICEAHGKDWDGGSIAAHRELTRRKPDPEGEDMGRFRRDVNTMLANPPASTGGGSGGVSIPPPSDVDPDFDPEELEDMSYDKWPASAKEALIKDLLTADLDRDTGNGVQITEWADENIPEHLNRRLAPLIGYITVYARGGHLAANEAVAEVAAVRSELAAQRELLVQLAAQQAGVTLTDEQVAAIAERIAETGQSVCTQVLGRLTAAGEALTGES
jgi:hypothetical protein